MTSSRLTKLSAIKMQMWTSVLATLTKVHPLGTFWIQEPRSAAVLLLPLTSSIPLYSWKLSMAPKCPVMGRRQYISKSVAKCIIKMSSLQIRQRQYWEWILFTPIVWISVGDPLETTISTTPKLKSLEYFSLSKFQEINYLES